MFAYSYKTIKSKKTHPGQARMGILQKLKKLRPF